MGLLYSSVDNSIKEFMDELTNRIPNEISFIDFKYTGMKYKNKLYLSLEEYDISKTLPPYLAEFNKNNPKYEIKNIRYISQSEGHYIDISNGSKGVAIPNGIYTMLFSVYFEPKK
jgi:hypothetical protein